MHPKSKGSSGPSRGGTSRHAAKVATSPLHPRNLHRSGYDFAALVKAEPALEKKLVLTPDGRQSIQFGDADSVFLLNKALLSFHYRIKDWSIPNAALCPPVPGRADYIHHAADLLGAAAPGTTIRVLDIGTGGGCIYPLLGLRCYGWNFVATDIQPSSLESSRAILAANPDIAKSIELRLQQNPVHMFRGIIKPGEWFNLTICNPPFHSSAQAARTANLERLDKMGLKHTGGQHLNFGGQGAELWCPGGEEAFIRSMIHESTIFSGQVAWFSTLVSKSSHLKGLQDALKKAGAQKIKVIPMAQGQKSSRILAWSFGG